MRKLWKALALVLALAMLLAAVSGCAAKTDAETESQQTETAAPAAQEETDASGVPGVEDEALAAKLIEQAKHPPPTPALIRKTKSSSVFRST